MSRSSILLVIDDDEDMREILSYSLQRPGWEIVEVEHGAAAIDYIAANGLPDLILLDMNMPVMNGWQFAAELRARNLWRVPVVVITAAHDAARSASEIGASGFIGKPFDRRSLIGTIERLLAPVSVAEQR
jgi:CheY-like chemotaxis protein